MSYLSRTAFLTPSYTAPTVIPAGSRILSPAMQTLDKKGNRLEVLKMYRKIVRSVPRVLMAYDITGGPTLERDVISNLRRQFERNRHVADVGVIAQLRRKADMEVTEALMMWKTKSHVCDILLDPTVDDPAQSLAKQQREKQLPKDAQESAFLTSFFQG